MRTINIPYSTGYMKLNLDERHLNEVLVSKAHNYEPSTTQEKLVEQALKEPVNSKRISEIAAGVNKVLVITSDHTRPVPSKITLPILLKEIRKNNPHVKIKILIATGVHRLTTKEEMLMKFGKELVEKEDIICHDSRDSNSMVYKGILPSGGELWVNNLVDWADVVVSEGFIEPHLFAGFSGGRKSILPGIASEKTVLANHCSKFIASNHSRTGNLKNNPIHKDMVYAADAAGLRFILNVVIDENKNIITAYAGHPQKAHDRGCDFVRELSSIHANYSDIVITSNGGYPLDQNIYQAVKGMTAAEACVNTGGVIIMVSACNDGHGGEEFYRWFADAISPAEVAEKIAKVKQMDTVVDQWEAQILARILTKYEVIMVTDQCDPKLIEDMYMKHAKTIEEALVMARAKMGKDAKITVIPDGVSVIIK